MKKYILFVITTLLPLLASAHHSFAPHFDADKPVSISGTIIEYERRNPHAYLNIRAEDASGRVTDWRCESHGFTQLARNGITPEMLAPGTRLGSPARSIAAIRICVFSTWSTWKMGANSVLMVPGASLQSGRAA